ncbi:16062_t:CDS:2, partial [Acaulospora colombiana]
YCYMILDLALQLNKNLFLSQGYPGSYSSSQEYQPPPKSYAPPPAGYAPPPPGYAPPPPGYAQPGYASPGYAGYPPPPQGTYNPQYQQYYYQPTPPPQVVVQETRRNEGKEMCAGLALGACLCCCLEGILF